MDTIYNIFSKDFIIYFLKIWLWFLKDFLKVMQQSHMQSCVCDYGFYLTFRKHDLFQFKFYSTLDDFSDWGSSGLCCRIDKPVSNCEGELKIDSTYLHRWQEKGANNYMISNIKHVVISIMKHVVISIIQYFTSETSSQCVK